jgi:hypothetical protein
MPPAVRCPHGGDRPPGTDRPPWEVADLCRLYGADKTFGLDHSECFKSHLRQSSLFKIVEVKKQNRLVSANTSSYHPAR